VYIIFFIKVKASLKLIEVDSKATLEDFLTSKKRLNLYRFYGNVMKKSVVTRMSLRSDKDVGTYLLKRIQITNDNSIFRRGICDN
jgi:hypothetical protein